MFLNLIEVTTFDQTINDITNFSISQIFRTLAFIYVSTRLLNTYENLFYSNCTFNIKHINLKEMLYFTPILLISKFNILFSRFFFRVRYWLSFKMVYTFCKIAELFNKSIKHCMIFLLPLLLRSLCIRNYF